MTEFLLEFWRSLYFLISPYAANAIPPLVKGKTPIDGGKNFLDGKRILGDGKTWEGLVAGTLFGTFCGGVAWLFYNYLNAIAKRYGFTLPYISPFNAFLLSIGALFGDMLGSFIKRRLSMERGAPAPLLDQLDFIFGAFAVGMFITDVNLFTFLWCAIITPIVHIFANLLAYVCRIKEVPW